MMGQKIMLNFKLILLGDSNTGKTAILNQYIYHTFTNTKATTGIDYFTKIFQIDDFIVKLNIFDTAGQQRYLAMTKSYFRGTNAVLFTYSLIEKQSFLNLPVWIKKFEQEAGNDAIKIVVGTKKDLLVNQVIKSDKKMNFPQKFNKNQIQNSNNQELKICSSLNQRKQSDEMRQINHDNRISQEQKQNMLKLYGLTFSFETSALLNENIDEVFEQICKYLILKQMNKSNNADQLNRSRVETQFSNTKGKNSNIQDQKLYLQQRRNQQDINNKSCC